MLLRVIGKFTGLKVTRIFPLVLLVKESQKQPEFWEVKTVTIGVCSRKKKWIIWTYVVFVGCIMQNFDNLGGGAALEDCGAT